VSEFSYLTRLICSRCGAFFDSDQVQTFCGKCQEPLLARYDLARLSQELDRDEIPRRAPGMWRWHELLPVKDPGHAITLGEGDAPLLEAGRLGEALGMSRLYIKEEGRNPTGTFKARGLAAAVSKARELGIRKLIIPTAGNAGGALAAYAARAGMQARIFMPEDTPRANILESQIAGAEVSLVKGLISDAAAAASELAQKEGWFDVSTFKEPYRLEGKKIMGYELAESFGWELPDVIVYPTGGGTGLVGMWKAFDEMEELNWLEKTHRGGNLRRSRRSWRYFFMYENPGWAMTISRIEHLFRYTRTAFRHLGTRKLDRRSIHIQQIAVEHRVKQIACVADADAFTDAVGSADPTGVDQPAVHAVAQDFALEQVGVVSQACAP
jgi:hypothetical protein